MDGGLKEKKMNINIEIKGQQAHIVNQQSLISGTSNLEEIKFDFSSEWDGYTKTAVIYVDDYSRQYVKEQMNYKSFVYKNFCVFLLIKYFNASCGD